MEPYKRIYPLLAPIPRLKENSPSSQPFDLCTFCELAPSPQLHLLLAAAPPVTLYSPHIATTTTPTHRPPATQRPHPTHFSLRTPPHNTTSHLMDNFTEFTDIFANISAVAQENPNEPLVDEDTRVGFGGGFCVVA
ncbi:hypothetical protein R3P38DRAFT_3230473 [Favolaschia claudopus]|uniref:Uncharacterized protein n=1 Tax=Favolaschia claudopus TaxID=2862362 RepID=A0AAV9ZMR0_9AGAR